MHELIAMTAGAGLVLMAFYVVFLLGQLKSARTVNDHLQKANTEMVEACTKIRADAAAIVERERQFLAKPTILVVNDQTAMQMAARILEYLPKPGKDTITH